MKTKYIVLIIILIFTSCTPKFNPSKEYGELQKVNLKDFEGKWKLINSYSNIDSIFIKIKISNDTLFKYSSSKFTNEDTLYEYYDTLKFKIKEDHIINKYFKLIPFIFIYFHHIDIKNEYSLTSADILVERNYVLKQGMILIIPAGMTFDKYNYYKRVN